METTGRCMTHSPVVVARMALRVSAKRASSDEMDRLIEAYRGTGNLHPSLAIALPR
jgi:hypothetical protein